MDKRLADGKCHYYTTDSLALADVAAQWVRYCNHIVPTYRAGDIIDDAQDRKILDSLIWSTSRPGDQFDTLLHTGEAVTSPVKYWEIGNEPSVSTSGSIGVSNGYRTDPDSYYRLYKDISASMKAADPSIKVGPCIVNGAPRREGKHLERILADHSIPVDFIAYHPYQRMGDKNTPEVIEPYLENVYGYHKGALKVHQDLVKASGRDLSKMEFAATEWCVSYWSYNETVVEGQMSHMLGSVETVFSFARLGLKAAHYWIWIANNTDGTSYPVTMAWQALQDHMGDQILKTVRNTGLRVYITRDSRSGEVALWSMNFSNSVDRELVLDLQNVTTGSKLGKTALRKDGQDHAALCQRFPNHPGRAAQRD